MDMNMKRLQDLIALIATAEKRVGSNGVRRTYTGKPSDGLYTVPTGSWALDLLLGGGYTSGGFIEISGPAGCGKSTLILNAIAALQEKDKVACLIDADHALQPAYAIQLGVKSESLLLSRPVSADQTLGIIEKLVHYDCVDLLVLDSVAPLIMEAHPFYRQTDKRRHRQTVDIHSFARKLAVILRKRKVVVLFMHPTLDKDVSRPSVFGDYAWTRLRVERADRVEPRTELSEMRVIVKVMKNRGKILCRSVAINIASGHGICDT